VNDFGDFFVPTITLGMAIGTTTKTRCLPTDIDFGSHRAVSRKLRAWSRAGSPGRVQKTHSGVGVSRVDCV
jgi:hypothetical protein